MFDEDRAEYAAARGQLAALTTPEEYAALRRTTLNAHYTHAGYVQAIWDTLARLGFDGGRVLEPGCGSGNFIGLAPDGAELTGVELDPVTAGIAAALYPDAQIRAESFAGTRLPSECFDAVAGNVPFASVKLADPVHNPGRRLSMHDHFIVKSLGLTRPGGMVALLTSRYTMDSRNPQARRQIADMADLVAAVRLPSGAHRRAAGTEVVTDLLILRRREPGRSPAAGASWEKSVPAAVPGGEVSVNEYFTAGPGAVLGEMRAGRGPHGPGELEVKGPADATEALTAALQEAVTRAEAAGLVMTGPRAAAQPAQHAAARPAEGVTLIPGMILVQPDYTFTRVMAVTDEGFVQERYRPPRTQAAELRQLIRIRDTTLALLRAEQDSLDDTAEISALRTRLNREYGLYTARYGPVKRFKWGKPPQRKGKEPAADDSLPDGEAAEREEPKPTRNRPQQGGFRNDPLYPIVYALEESYDTVTGRAVKADIFSQRVIVPAPPLLGADTAAEALAICLNTYAEVRLDEIARLLGVTTAEQARGELGTLVYDDPATGTPVWAPLYLSGNVREKLTAAETAAETDPQYAPNVTALREVVPRDMGPAEIEAQLGAGWIGPAYVQQFLRELLSDDNVTAEHTKAGNWEVSGGNRTSVAATSTWGTGRLCAQDLAQRLLSGTAEHIQVKDTVDRKEIPNREATEAARQAARNIAARFAQWVWEDPERSAILSHTYNHMWRARIPVSFDNVELFLPGLAKTLTLRKHQPAAIARVIYQGSAGLIHDTGAGKTLEAIIGVHERRRLGLSHKPCFVVQKHKLADFRDEYLRAYPGARLLVADTDDLVGDKRREFIARCATGNPDAIIISREAFTKIPVSARRRAAWLHQEKQELEDVLLDAKAHGSKRTVKEIEKKILRTEERLKARLEEIGQDTGLCYEDTGIDYVVVDEAQDYRRGPIVSSIPDLGQDGSDRATDLLLKLGHHEELYGETRVALLTATPWTNRISEIYTWERYLRGDIGPFDPWCRTFGKITLAYEMTPTGDFKARARLREILNAPDLYLRLRELSDFKLHTTGDLDLKLPRMAGGRPQIAVVDATTQHGLLAMELADRLRNLPGGPPQKGQDNHLSIQNDAIRAALDLRMIGWETDEPQKVDAVADLLYAKWLKHRDAVYLQADGTQHPVKGSLVLVFASQGTPGGGKEWNFYDELRGKLLARGMPQGLVRYIHEARTMQEKEELFHAARNGEVFALLGSTAKLGMGTNVQDRAVGLIQVTSPWNWDEPHQEIGRVEREGNLNDEFFCIRVVTSPSCDALKWERARQKEQAFRQLMTGRIEGRTIRIPDDDLSTAEIMAAASGDPRLLELAQLQGNRARLELVRSDWGRAQTTLAYRARDARTEITRLEKTIQMITDALPVRRDTRGQAFAMTVEGTRHAKRPAAAAALTRLITGHAGVLDGRQPVTWGIGEIGGFGLTLEIRPDAYWGPPIRLHLNGIPDHGDPVGIYPGELGQGKPLTGLVTRLENRIAGLEDAQAGATARIGELRAEADAADAETGGTFPQQDELDQVRTRLEVLEKELFSKADSGPGTAGASVQSGSDDTPAAAGAGSATSPGTRQSAPPEPGPARPGGTAPSRTAHGPADSPRDAARRNALAVLGGTPGGGVPDAEEFADYFARTYGRTDPGIWPLATQVYADEWLPRQPDDHPLKNMASTAPGTPGRLVGDDPDVLFAAHWTAAHPHAGEISQMRQAALDDPAVTAAARQSDWQNYQIEFGRWAARYTGQLHTATPGAITAMQAALADDKSFAADLTTTLSHQVHLISSGERLSQPAMLTVAGRVSRTAVDEAAAGWRARIQQAHTTLCGCQGGCDQCALPAGAEDRLKLAAEIDIHLARAGLSHRRRDISWHPAPGEPARDDPAARTYTITVRGAADDQPSWKLAIPEHGEFYRAARDGRWPVTGGLAAQVLRRGTNPADEAAREFLRLAVPAPAAGPPPQAAGGAKTGQATDLHAAAAGHGLEAEASADGDLIIRSPDDTLGGFAVRQEHDGGRLLSKSGRVIPPDRPDTYLTGYAAQPRSDPDTLYREMLARLGHPGADAHETAWAKSRGHLAMSDASTRASSLGASCYLYADGNAYVCSEVPPAGPAYYAVTPQGEWSHRIDGATVSLTRRPSPAQLSLISGEQAGRPGPAPDGPAAPASAGSPDAAAGWTATHPHAAEIETMRQAAHADSWLAQVARVNSEGNFGRVFERWADDYAAALFPEPGPAATAPPFGEAYFDDLPFAARLRDTLRHQIYEALRDTAPAEADEAGEPRPPGPPAAPAPEPGPDASGYGSGPELAAGHLAAGRAWQAVRYAAGAAPPLGNTGTIIQRHYENTETVMLQAAAADGPQTAIRAYTAAAEAAGRLGGATTDPGCADYYYALRSATGQLADAARRHATRISAAGPAAEGLLTDPAAQYVRVHALTDPLSLLPEPYPGRAAADEARSTIFSLASAGPAAEGSDLPGTAAHVYSRLRSLQMLPDRDHLGARIGSWREALADTLAALADLPSGSAAAGPLGELARALSAHRLRLDSYRIRAEATARPYDSADTFTAGAAALRQAHTAWRQSGTGAHLDTVTDRDARGSGLWEPREAHRALRDALYQLAARGTGADLTQVSAHAAAAAHAAYAMLLNHQAAGFRDPADHALLQSLTEAAYLHAARIDAARGAGTAPLIAAGLANLAATTAAPAAQAHTPGPAPATSAPPPAGLVIEHHHAGTVVRGTDKTDEQLHEILTHAGFRFSRRLNFWWLPRPWSQDTRGRRVRRVTSALERLGRQFTLQDQPSEAAAPSEPAPITPGEPYASQDQADEDYQQAKRAWWAAGDTDAGRKMLSYAQHKRPDAAALRAAYSALPDSGSLTGTAGELAPVLTAWAQAAQALLDNLSTERHRAPKFREQLEALTTRTRILASRMAATAAADGFPGQPGARPAVPRVTVLHGHTSRETAHVVDDYPYGFRLRCKIRYWLETGTTGASRGQMRLVSQTTDPKHAGEVWNKPKASTYCAWGVMYLDASQHVQWHAVGRYMSGAQDARMRLDGTYEQLSGAERDAYDRLARLSQRAGGWEHWDKAVTFIAAHLAEHGEVPSAEQVRDQPGFHLDSGDSDLAAAAARQIPTASQPSPAQDSPRSAGKPAVASDAAGSLTASGRPVSENADAAASPAADPEGQPETATRYVYREAGERITATAPPGAGGYLSVTPQGTWTEHWRGTTRPLHPPPGEDPAPDYPLTLTEARALRAKYHLEVLVTPVAGRAYVSLAEPGAATAPVLSFAAGETEVFACQRPMPPSQGIAYLSARRQALDEWAARHSGDILTATTAVPGWTWRTAHLTAHLTEPGHNRGVCDHLSAAVRHARQGHPVAAEEELRSAERARAEFVLAPVRETQITEAIHDAAPRYASTGTPGRYVAESQQVNALLWEWDWIEDHIAAHPEVLTGPPLTPEDRQARDTARRETSQAAATEASRKARTAYDTGDYREALNLIDDAECHDPGRAADWDRIRAAIRAGTAGPAAAASAGDPAVTPEVAPGQETQPHHPVPNPQPAAPAAAAHGNETPDVPEPSPAARPGPDPSPAADGADRSSVQDDTGPAPGPDGVPMRFMNSMDIEEAVIRWEDHLVLGPAARTLAHLEAWANSNSDGWPYWPKPARAAARLMTLIERDGTAAYIRDTERPDATLAELRQAYTPIKAFRTKHQADFTIEEPGQVTRPAAHEPDPLTRRAEPDTPGEPLTPAEIRLAIRRWIGSNLPEYVQALAGSQPMRNWIEQQIAPTGRTGCWYETYDPAAEDTRRENRADPSPDGLIVLRGQPGHRQETIRWEEIPAWLQNGLTSERRAELTETASALTALSLRRSSDGATGQPSDEERVTELRTRLTRSIDQAWAAIDTAPPPTTAQLEESASTYRDTRPVQDTLFAGQEAGSPDAAPGLAATEPAPPGPAVAAASATGRSDEPDAEPEHTPAADAAAPSALPGPVPGAGPGPAPTAALPPGSVTTKSAAAAATPAADVTAPGGGTSAEAGLAAEPGAQPPQPASGETAAPQHPGTGPAMADQTPDETRPGEQPPVPDGEAEAGEPAGQAWYHGTYHELEPGDTIEPGHPSNYGQYDDHVYFTSTQLAGGAWAYDAIEARLDSYDEDVSGLQPRVYQVEPTGPYDLDLSNEENYDEDYHDHKSRHPLRVIREVPYIYDPHPGAEIAGGEGQDKADARGPAGKPTGPAATGTGLTAAASPAAGATGEPERQARETGPTDILAGVSATAVTRQIIDLAFQGGLRPHLDEDGPRSGAHRVILNGEGRDALFGAIYIGSSTGKILRAVLTHGNNGRERRYEKVADVRAVLTSWLALQGSDPAAAGHDRPADPAPRFTIAPATRGQLRHYHRHRHELHAAVSYLAGQSAGYAPASDGPGFTAADTYLGHFLADIPHERWDEHLAATGWDMLRDYTSQLAQAGIRFADLPLPPGAHEMDPQERAAARALAQQAVTAIRHELYRPGASFVRCDGASGDAMLGIPAGDQGLAAEAAKIPGSVYDAAAQSSSHPFRSLPAVIALADRHGIAVTPEVRALVAVAADRTDTRTGSAATPDTGAGPPDIQDPAPSASTPTAGAHLPPMDTSTAAGPAPGGPAARQQNQDPPPPSQAGEEAPGSEPASTQAAAAGLPAAATGSSPPGQPTTDTAKGKTAVSEQREDPGPGNGQEAQSPAGVAAGGAAAPEAAEPPAGPAPAQSGGTASPDGGHQALIDEATRRHEQGLPPRDAPDSVVYAWLTAANPATMDGWREEVARHLSALRPSMPPAAAGTTGRPNLPGGGRSWQHQAIASQIAGLDVPSPGGHGTGAAGELPRRKRAYASDSGIEQLIDDATRRFEQGLPPRHEQDGVIYQALRDSDTASAAPAGGWRAGVIRQLTSTPRRGRYEIRYADQAHAGVPVTAFTEEAAVRTARQMSASGREVHAVQIGSDGPRLIGIFRGTISRLLTAPATGPGLEMPATGGLPPDTRIPAASKVAGTPVPLQPGDSHAGQQQFPGGISPLPVLATSGGPLRPGRLLHPDGTALQTGRMGVGGPPWTGVAAGVVPATGVLAPGWLQVVRRDGGRLEALHPALISPQDVHPYEQVRYRQAQRWPAFDAAEASGRDAARLFAALVDRGDLIRVEQPPRSGSLQVREVTDIVRQDGLTVEITTADSTGAQSTQVLPGRETVEVLIPARHPDQDSPAARWLFAPSEVAAPTDAAGTADPGQGDRLLLMEARITELEEALLRLREDSSGPGPTPPTPDRARWQTAVTGAEALQRARDMASQALPTLRNSAAWQRTGELARSARQVAADAARGLLRFTNPGQALRAWNAVWARACEMTGDLASGLMNRLRRGSRGWNAARALHHTAAEGVAHARGWLPRSEHLPPGSYEPPPGFRAPAWAKADAATRLHDAGAGPLSRLDFPGALEGVPARRVSGRRDTHRAARTALDRSQRRAPVRR